MVRVVVTTAGRAWMAVAVPRPRAVDHQVDGAEAENHRNGDQHDVEQLAHGRHDRM
jgi:hypothetical protein